jgi:hypothetical protein
LQFHDEAHTGQRIRPFDPRNIDGPVAINNAVTINGATPITVYPGALTVTGKKGSIGLVVSTTSVAADGIGDLVIYRPGGSTINTQAGGPNIEMYDGTTAAMLQVSGGQTELWCYNAAWNQRLVVPAVGGLVVMAPTSGAALTVNGLAGVGLSAMLILGANSSGSRGLTVYGGTSASDFSVIVANAAGSQNNLLIYGNGVVAMPHYGAGAATFDASGNLSSVSDERVKSSIRPFSRGLADVLKLKPILHGYTVESGLDQTKGDYVGFSAQNVQSVIPEAVGQMKDGMLTLSDRGILAALVNAVKELYNRTT